MGDIVEQTFAAFYQQCKTYLPSDTCDRIKVAYEYAREAHGSQRRKSGEPYITHPITVAHYMADLFVDESVLIAALLHDVAEDTPRTLDDIEHHFGAQTRHLVNGVTHLANVSHLEDIANLFLAMSSDVRVVLIKLYDRLHNMRTLDCMPDERRRRKALETLRIYVPLAAKLGIWRLKTEFEALILENVDPAAYHLISNQLEKRRASVYPKLIEAAGEIQDALRQYRIPSSYRIQQRSMYRIYEEMGDDIESDLLAKAFQLVIQVDSLPEAYLALGHIHSQYPHVAGSLTDSIGNPRDIFYRALHTAIIVPRHRTPVNIRIRTYELDRESDIGIFTKIQFSPPDKEKQPKDAPWLTQLPTLYHESENAQKFVESIFQDILQKHIICYTPRGDAISLPRGATVLDFAYHVHTEIGHECRGAVVNGEFVEVSSPLTDRDQVEILRTRGATPRHEWLDDMLVYATTAYAKRKIRAYFRKQSLSVLIRKGRETLAEERRRLNIFNITAQQLADHLQLDNANMLYWHIGNGSVQISEAARLILEQTPDSYVETHPHVVTVEDHKGNEGRLPYMGKPTVHLAKCCTPIIGDKISAHIKPEVVFLHRANCRNIRRSKHPENFIRLEWLTDKTPKLLFHLRLEGYDRGGLIRDVSIPIANLGANILESQSKVINDKIIIMRLKIHVASIDDFIRIMHRLTTLQNITVVQRMDVSEAQRWFSSEEITSAAD